MTKIKAWLSAARFRTLPLSISGIIVGTALANFYGHSNTTIFVLALATTLGFQITSNFANDYGDGVKGTDNDERIGPKRAYQSGLLSRKELKRGIIIACFINLLLVLAVVYYAFGTQYLLYLLIFALLGILSIWAAIRYTVGSSAYGYKGFGDIFVFLFFGILGVLGSMFLYTKFLVPQAILPAITIGLLSTGVLNLNNLRDFASDKNAGKKTLVVQMGFKNGKIYHYTLLVLAFIGMLVFVTANFESWKNGIPLLAFIPIFLHLKKVRSVQQPVLLDPELKKLALSTFLLALLFYFCYNNFL
ncbi:1,4-dihydroxy-2-naphthoate octaprenyltransferase [Spongiimicrobium sp. 3-5]|uniref:1,4-dihydroxy-2-naphthoate octaprenyltransferase n=1 Tax=Spongiimicrobium sp. 3-5 TaxID=3332596 RepID=UPI00397F080A